MNFDQYEERSTEIQELARVVAMLVDILVAEDGSPKDFADKEGRAALIKAIGNVPKEIPSNLREEDRKLLKEAIEECRETRKLMKQWWWYVIAVMAVASAAISLCVVILLR